MSGINRQRDLAIPHDARISGVWHKPRQLCLAKNPSDLKINKDMEGKGQSESHVGGLCHVPAVE